MSTPADHAGEVALIPDDMDCGHRVWVRDDEGGELWSCPLCMYLEARAEVDRLRAEVERLEGAASDIERLSDTYTVEGTEIVLNRIIDLRRERDSLRVALAAVGEVANDLLEHGLRFDLNPTMNASSPLGYLDYIARMDNHARQIGANLRRLLAADPVSLADVRTVDKARALETLMMHRLVGPRYQPLGAPGLSHTHPYANGDWACACGAGGPDGYRSHMQHIATELIQCRATATSNG